MVSKSSLLFLVLLLSALTLDAKSLLYKVTSASSTVYILGSIHLARAEIYPLKNVIEEAYDKSDVLVVELDAESQSSARYLQSAMERLGTYPKGKTLRSELSESTYTALKSYTDKAGLPLKAMEKMRPWTVMLQLSMAEMLRLGYSPELGIDKYFLDRAKQERKCISALETIQEQMELLSRDDRAYQEKLLQYTLSSISEMEPMLDKLSSSWKNGDAKAMEKMFLLSIRDDKSLKDIYDDLITKRNYRMTQKIESYLKTERDYFVIVGAGHVIGKDGIVDLLKKRGYKVIQQ